MPRLFHRPPKYRRHKSTNQAVVSFLGEKIYLGPFGSQKSHERYQEILKKWEKARHQQSLPKKPDEWADGKSKWVVDAITIDSLRAKRRSGAPISVTRPVQQGCH